MHELPVEAFSMMGKTISDCLVQSYIAHPRDLLRAKNETLNDGGRSKGFKIGVVAVLKSPEQTSAVDMIPTIRELWRYHGQAAMQNCRLFRLSYWNLPFPLTSLPCTGRSKAAGDSCAGPGGSDACSPLSPCVRKACRKVQYAAGFRSHEEQQNWTAPKCQ